MADMWTPNNRAEAGSGDQIDNLLRYIENKEKNEARKQQLKEKQDEESEWL